MRIDKKISFRSGIELGFDVNFINYKNTNSRLLSCYSYLGLPFFMEYYPHKNINTFVFIGFEPRVNFSNSLLLNRSFNNKFQSFYSFGEMDSLFLIYSNSFSLGFGKRFPSRGVFKTNVSLTTFPEVINLNLDNNFRNLGFNKELELNFEWEVDN